MIIQRGGFVFLVIVLLLSCNGNDDQANSTRTWLIDANRVFDGGPGKDGIPSIDNPSFYSVAQTTLQDDQLVVGVYLNGEAKAYPHDILDWHEIVNDEVGGTPVAITYCPLTGTAIGYDRRLRTGTTTFGVSGLLFNSNLIPYDRISDSHWTQIERRSVEGEFSGDSITHVPLFETTWATWKALYPQTLVMNRSTGFSRDYGRYPYGDYITSNNLIFPVEPDDTRLHRKERGLGVFADVPKFYPLAQFEESKIFVDTLGNRPIVVAGSQQSNYQVSFFAAYQDGSTINLPEDALNTTSTGAIFKDSEGNEWSAFGIGLAGPRVGEKLDRVESFMGYWMAFGSFYPDIQIMN